MRLTLTLSAALLLAPLALAAQLTGTVKWYNNTKGFGFITPADGKSPDILVHFKDVKITPPILHEGEEVFYDFKKGPKGLEAVNVVVAEDSHFKSFKAGL